MDRRKMLKLTGTAVAGTSVLGIDAFASDKSSLDKEPKGKGKKVLVIGAHPDDPESCCGGTMLKLKNAGCDVVAVYMTKGEAGVPNLPHAESSAIRVKEAEAACKVLGARAIFLTQIDGSSEVNKERYKEMLDIIQEEKPDIVFTHWPIDSHRDHRICSILTFDAWRQSKYSFELYYFEAMTGVQSQGFAPTDWVDISEVSEKKKEALYCHKCQNPDEWYDESHGRMELFRGLEHRCGRAEAFFHLRRTGNDIETL